MSDKKEIVKKIDEILRENLLYSGMTYSDTLKTAEEIYNDIFREFLGGL